MRQSQTITIYVPKRGRAPRRKQSISKLMKQEYKANVGPDNKQIVSEMADNIPQENS